MEVFIGLVVGFILWRIYHKFFRVFYFGNPVYQVLIELGTAFVIGYYLTLSVIAIGKKIAESMVGLIVYGFMILVTIYIIILICYLIKQKKNIKNKDNAEELNEDSAHDAESENNIQTNLLEKSAEWVRHNKLATGLVLFFYIGFVVAFIAGHI